MDKKPTIVDVAERAGVSIKTVSRVINNERHVSAETRTRVRKVVAELGFEANELARGMRNQSQEKSFVIGQLYGDPGGTYTSDIQMGLISRCAYFGYHLVIEELDYRAPDFERRMRTLVRRLRLDGVVLTAPLTDNDVLQMVLEEAGIPFVCVTPLIETRRTPSVRIDEQRAAYQLTQHLIALGHRRVGFIKGLMNHAGTHLRFAGFEQALAEAGLSVDPDLVEEGEFRYFSAIHCANRLLGRADPPSAIFASNDEMAAAVIKVAHERDFKLPDDLSVVGFDDIPTAEMVWPALTTVRQPVMKLGAAAGDLLFARLAGAGGGQWPNPVPHLVLQHDIVLRGSTAPAKT